MYFLCAIAVTFISATGNRTDFVDELEGRLISQTEFNIVADFSGHAKVKGLTGDYSNVLVPKAECKKAE